MVWLHGSRAVQVVSQARKPKCQAFPPSASVSSQICAPTVGSNSLATARAHKKARSEGEHHTSLGSLAVVWPRCAQFGVNVVCMFEWEETGVGAAGR